MAKKKKKINPLQAGPPAEPLAAPAPPALSPEELRRLHIVDNAKDSLKGRLDELQGLLKLELTKRDQLAALALCGESIMGTALHTRAQLRAAEGRTDASLAAKGAYVRTALRKVEKIAEMFEHELTAWNDVVETLKPVVDACTRTVKDLDLPGMKAAIGCSGEALFDDEGLPTQKAATPLAPTAEPPQAAPEPEPEPRPTPTLGMVEPAPVIDVEPEPEPEPEPEAGPLAEHPLDGMDEAKAEEVVTTMLEQLEEAGVEEGLKRKDWKAAETAWLKSWPEDCILEITKNMYDRLAYAIHQRRPLSWDVVTEKELLAHWRKLSIAAEDPAFNDEKGA